MEHWLYTLFTYTYVKKVYHIGLPILVPKYNLEDITTWFRLEYNIMFEKNETKKKKGFFKRNGENLAFQYLTW